MELEGSGMTTLVVNELRTTLEQDFYVDKRLQLSAIRLNLYLHNDPSGTFTLSVKNGSDTIATSSLTVSTIKTNAGLSDNQYHHGFFRFDFSDIVPLIKNVTYTLELSSSGYTFSDSSYIGWIKEFENNTNTLIDSTDNDFEKDFSFQLWGYRR